MAENIRKKMPSFKQLKDFYKSERGKRVRFGIFLVLNFGNVLSDWLLYRSVALVEEGLVVGPQRKGITDALRVFSIIGTITVFPAVFLDWQEIMEKEENDGLKKVIFHFTNDEPRGALKCVTNDGLRGAIIFVTDIPLMFISILIVVCREEDNSYYQMGKALVIVFVSLIHVILSWLKIYIIDEFESKNGKRALVFKNRCVIFQLLLAISLFLLTQTEENDNGKSELRVPHAILKGEYDDRKYFTNVSIYFSHPYLDYDTNPSRFDNINFIRLLSIYDLKNSMTDQTVNIHYDSTHTIFLFQSSGKSDQCFTKNNKTKTMETCSSDEPPQAGQFAFTFHYVKPSFPNLQFGDITYNMYIGNNTNCTTPNFPVVYDMATHIGDPSSVFLRYYKTNPNITEESSLKLLSNSSYEFYQLSDFLSEDIWKPAKCGSTGSHAPHRDESLRVQCL